MTTSFFGGAFFGGEFFNEPAVSAAVVVGGGATRRRRKVIIGDRLYEVDRLREIEHLLDEVVRRDEPPPVIKAKPKVRIVDRIDTKLKPVDELPVPRVSIDWTPLWEQLAAQDRAYADALERALRRRNDDDDDIEMLLLTLH